jgi:serine/threonine protein kinase
MLGVLVLALRSKHVFGPVDEARTELERLRQKGMASKAVLNRVQLIDPPVACLLLCACACADGTLLTHVQRQKALPEHQARWLFQQLILALDYCHRIGVSNRDIKLDNILLDKSCRGRPDWPILKICDWGYARSGATSEASSKVGTLSYMAPEVLQNNSYSTKRADIWSCGVVLYAMLVSASQMVEDE